MAGPKGGRGPRKPVKDDTNVISLFGTSEGPSLAVLSPDEAEQSKELMINALEGLIASVRSGDTTGIIAIGLKGEGLYGAESYMGGPGVFGQIDRAVGIMEMVKHDLVREARREDD